MVCGPVHHISTTGNHKDFNFSWFVAYQLIDEYYHYLAVGFHETKSWKGSRYYFLFKLVLYAFK